MSDDVTDTDGDRVALRVLVREISGDSVARPVRVRDGLGRVLDIENVRESVSVFTFVDVNDVL